MQELSSAKGSELAAQWLVLTVYLPEFFLWCLWMYKAEAHVSGSTGSSVSPIAGVCFFLWCHQALALCPLLSGSVSQDSALAFPISTPAPFPALAVVVPCCQALGVLLAVCLAPSGGQSVLAPGQLEAGGRRLLSSFINPWRYSES